MAQKTSPNSLGDRVFDRDWALIPGVCTVLLGRKGELNSLFFRFLLFYALFPQFLTQIN
jgi:hypothetical protein